MPHMKCIECGEVYHYRNKRGTKAPKSCRVNDCNAELKKATWYDGSYEIVNVEIKKGKMINCALCGKRRKDSGNNVKKIEETTYFKTIAGSWILGTEKESIKLIKAGQLVCWYHNPNYHTRID